MKRVMLNLLGSFLLSFTIFLLIPMIALAESGEAEAITVMMFLSGMSWGGWVAMGFAILGFILFAATMIIKATPSPKDDEALAKIKAHKIWGFIIRFLEAFALNKLQKKK